MVSIGPIISGFLAGFLAGIFQKYVWEWIQRPELKVEGEIQKLRRHSNEQNGRNAVTTIFRVPVRNIGKSAAYNCKPFLRLEGHSKPLSYVDWSEMTEDSGIEFKINTGLCWSDGDNPASITINRGSTEYFDLVAIPHMQNPDEEVERGLEIVTFPTESGWNGPSPVEMVSPTFKEGIPRPSEGDFRINRDQVTRADYTIAQIEVTSENSKKVSANLRFSNNNGWPDIEIVDT